MPDLPTALLDAGFWLARADHPDAALMSHAAIPAFNARVYDLIDIPPVLALPDTLDADAVRDIIGRIAPPAGPHYDGAGQPVGAAYFDALRANASPPLVDPVPVRFGLAIRRTDVRTFPTADVLTSAPFEFALDRFQETTIDVGWPVAALATSRDGRWLFCLTPHYWGWVRAEHVALGTREAVAGFVQGEPSGVITASRGLVAFAAGGGVTPQMGTRLPLVEERERAFRVSVPVRVDGDGLALTEGFIARGEGAFTAGHLPCTLRTLFAHAFKLLGEPYAWGGSRLGTFGRDCSRFIRDVTAVTGVVLPRNGSQQAVVGALQATFAPGMSPAERRALLVEQAPPGAILVMPGHVMLYLGHVDGEPYAIHATFSHGWSQVVVSDLTPGAGTPTGSLLERLTRAVTLSDLTHTKE